MARTILVVDDSATVRTVVEWIFHGTGDVVVPAASAAEARAAVDGRVPDLTLIAYHLPDGSGFDLCRELRGRAGFEKARLFVLTGQHHPYDEAQVAACGANGEIRKPFKVDPILQALASEPVAVAVSDAPAAAPAAPAPAPAAEPAATESGLLRAVPAPPAPSRDSGLHRAVPGPPRPPSGAHRTVPVPPPGQSGVHRIPTGTHRAVPVPPPGQSGLHRVPPRPGAPAAPPAPPAEAPPAPAIPAPMLQSSAAPGLRAGPTPTSPGMPRPVGARAVPQQDLDQDDTGHTAPMSTSALVRESLRADAQNDRDTREVDAVAPPTTRAPDLAAPVVRSEDTPRAPIAAAPAPAAPAAPAPAAPAAEDEHDDDTTATEELSVVSQDQLRAIVAELLPGIVRQALSDILTRELNDKVVNHGVRKVDQFIENDLPRIAEKLLERRGNG